jgi:nucleotide-binding universal stress UspA family protein
MIKHILVPLDGSTVSECVLPHTIALARSLNARVTLLQVLEPPRATCVDPLAWSMGKVEAQVYLGEQAARLQTLALPVEPVVLEGNAAQSILHFAQRRAVDLIVLSSHGQGGLNSWSLGATARKTLMRAPASTLLVRASRPPGPDVRNQGYRRLLLALDGSLRAECVLPMAVALAGTFRSQVILAHVVRRPEMSQRLPLSPQEAELVERLVAHNRSGASAYLEYLQARLDLDVEVRLAEDQDVVACLHDLAARELADLVVLSAHGYTGNPGRRYGSVAASFMEYGSASLLVVQDLPPQESRSTQAEIAAQADSGPVRSIVNAFVPVRTPGRLGTLPGAIQG